MPMIRRVGRPGLVGLAARTAVVAGTASAVGGAAARSQQRRSQEQMEQAQYETARQQTQAPAAAQPAPVAVPPDGGTDVVAQLQQLSALQAAGALSPEEFAQAKAKLLG